PLRMPGRSLATHRRTGAAVVEFRTAFVNRYPSYHQLERSCMIQSLDRAERQTALVLAVLLALLGMAMAGVAGRGVMAVHGVMAMAIGIGLSFALAGALHAAEPGVERLSR